MNQNHMLKSVLHRATVRPLLIYLTSLGLDSVLPFHSTRVTNTMTLVHIAVNNSHDLQSHGGLLSYKRVERSLFESLKYAFKKFKNEKSSKMKKKIKKEKKFKNKKVQK